MASNCITQGADEFSMAIAVAPVTNWKYYDSIYTERFMRTPQENEDGYENNSPINHVEKLKGKLFSSSNILSFSFSSLKTNLKTNFKKY